MKSSGISVIGMVERLYVAYRFSKALFVAKHDTPDASASGLSKDDRPKANRMRRTQEVLATWLRGPRAPQ